MRTIYGTKPSPEISSFRGEFKFLSNFWFVPINWEGVVYPTTEHAYQASKTLDREERVRIAQLKSPGDAMREGRKLPVRADWEQVKLGVMLALTRLKFSSGNLRTKLLATGDAHLVEGNTWQDTFWGICDGVGSNHLGKILMQVRDELRANP